jgi:hypothetical protein
MKLLSFSFALLITLAAGAQSRQANPHVLTPTVTCDTVIQTSTCAGGNVIVPFTVTGGNFSFGNTFTAQLSNAFGQFTAPVNIGSLFWIGSGVIFATIPPNTNFGFFYRIRVIASNPSDTSNASPNPVFVTQVAQLNQIVATPHDYVCPGDTITLTAINIANSYSWSTGDTTMSIQVTQPGIYSVSTTDPLMCTSTAYDTLYQSCTGITENDLENSLGIYPNPSAGDFSICLKSGQMMEAGLTILSVLGEEVYHHQEFLGMGNHIPVNAGPLEKGIYVVRITIGQTTVSRKIVIR